MNKNGCKPLLEPYLKNVFLVVFIACSVANNEHNVAIKYERSQAHFSVVRIFHEPPHFA